MSNKLIDREAYDPAAVAEYVCDTLCRHRHNIDLTQDELEEICENCNMERLLGITEEIEECKEGEKMGGEILFRGKRKDNGEWIEGLTLQWGGDTDPQHEKHLFLTPNGYSFPLEVDPETICRCTGKEYMNCEVAYEGDIFESQSIGLRMVLKYGTYQAYCPEDKCYMDSVGFYAEAKGYQQMPIGDLKDYALKIGNIFDNPELLEVQNEKENK